MADAGRSVVVNEVILSKGVFDVETWGDAVEVVDNSSGAGVKEV